MNYSIDSFPGREIFIKDKKHLYFGGTSYLGLQTNTDFQDLFIKNLKKYGTNYGASRKSNIKMTVFDEAEDGLANMVGSEACITLSSGYLAGQLLAKHFGSNEFRCFYAPNSHSALFQKEAVSFKSFKGLVISVKQFLDANSGQTPVVFLDSIDTLEASYPNFIGLKDLFLNKVILVVDDSHGVGVMGLNGSGAYQIIEKFKPKELIVCCSLGKGFGIQAGAVFATKSRINLLTNSELYGGASPAAPAALSTLSRGHHIYKEQREKLKVNLELFKSNIDVISRFHYIEDHPAFTFKNVELADYLEKKGILLTNFKYPNAEGPLISRIVISAAHTKRDIELLSEILNSYK